MQRIWFLVLIALLALVMMGVSVYGLTRAPEPEFYGTPLQNPPLMEGVSLLNVRGETVDLLDFNGKLTVVFFGFVACPDVCPLTMGRLAKIYRDLGEPEDVQVVMITVDPERDTPEVVQAYAQAFHPSFVGLSGSNSDIARAARSFFIGYNQAGDAGVVHTDTVALLDRRGQMRLIYNQDKILYIEPDLRQILASRTF